MEFSKLLKEERKAKGLTQREMAEKLSITLRAYQNYEALGKDRREPGFALLTNIADILEVTTDYLLGREK